MGRPVRGSYWWCWYLGVAVVGAVVGVYAGGVSLHEDLFYHDVSVAFCAPLDNFAGHNEAYVIEGYGYRTLMLWGETPGSFAEDGRVVVLLTSISY
jgi:hypothetical protein